MYRDGYEWIVMAMCVGNADLRSLQPEVRNSYYF